MKLDDGILMPRRATIDSAGYDVFAPCDLNLVPGELYKLDFGFAFEDGDLPEGTFAQLHPRSGFGSKYGLRLRNTTGIIDRDYRYNVLATISVDEPLMVIRGQALLQFVICNYHTMANEIRPTMVRDGGFGSTSA